MDSVRSVVVLQRRNPLEGPMCSVPNTVRQKKNTTNRPINQNQTLTEKEGRVSMPVTLKQDLDFVDETIIVAEIKLKLNLTTKAAEEFVRIALANALLMNRKQLDYGPTNISEFGPIGAIMRMNDKMQRIKHLHKGGRRKKAQNESLMDSFRDISNYGIIAMMLELNRWPLNET